MRPTYVADVENLRTLEREFRKTGATIVYIDARSFRVYRDGKAVQVVRVKDS
jgi:hypothetical protein